MRIKVKGNGHSFVIPVPTGLIFSKPSAWIYIKLLRKDSGRAALHIPGDVDISMTQFFSNLPEEAVYAICAEIMRIKRTHGHWELLKVHSARGEEVSVTL